MAVDGDDEVRPGREVAVDRAHPDAGLGRDVADRRVDAGGDEDRGGGVEQRLLVAPGVGPLAPGRHVPGLGHQALLRSNIARQAQGYTLLRPVDRRSWRLRLGWRHGADGVAGGTRPW